MTGLSASLRAALDFEGVTDGRTHHFYHYPARFSPELARAVITDFSEPRDWVLDPFMGGGTTVVEGLALGRRVIGSDLNALAHFVSDTRTTPLSKYDERVIRDWALLVADDLAQSDVSWVELEHIRNLPRPVEVFISGALGYAEPLNKRQHAFARCALLRLGQWALDCRDFAAPKRRQLAQKLPQIIDGMFVGLREFAADCEAAGIHRADIPESRVLLHRSAVGLDREPVLGTRRIRPRLVLTSPPYPGVHVLYHRWQYRGRKETPAPYWIANVPDGFGESYYRGGSRTEFGVANYFQMIRSAFESVARVIADDAFVIQLVGFSNTADQLPRYLACMEEAGFEEANPGEFSRATRTVPNRKWYARLKGPVDASTEFLLVHRLSLPRRQLLRK